MLVILDRQETSAAVLRAVGAFAGTGLMATKDRIVSGRPVVDEEMFTNAWFDERAEQLLDLLTAWRDQGTGFELREVPEDADADDAVALELETLRNLVDAAQEGEWR